MALKLKDDELRSAFANLRVLLVQNKTDNEITDKLGLTWEAMQELKRRFYDHDAEIMRSRSTEHSYVRYAIEQRRCLDDLDTVIKDYEKQKNVSGYVAAVRAKSEILERMMKTGVDLGLIKRIADGQGYEAGEAIKQMANPQFRQYITAEITILNQMIVKYGDQNILDVAVGPIHRTAVAKKFPVRKHSRTKVHGGRRVVKKEGA